MLLDALSASLVAVTLCDPGLTFVNWAFPDPSVIPETTFLAYVMVTDTPD